MGKIFKKSILIIFICFFACAEIYFSNAKDIHEIFVTANQDYRKNDFHKAILGYEKILNSRVENGLLYYNLGNCYFKLGKIGKAILYYNKSKNFIPRNADLNMNLNFARTKTIDKIEEKDLKNIFKKIFFWYFLLSKNEIIFIFIGINLIFWIIASLKLFIKKEIFTYMFYVFLCAQVLFGATLCIKIYSSKYIIDGVVTSREISIRSGNSESDTVLFKLHDGAELRILDEKEGFVKIRLQDGKMGFAEKRFIDVVNPR